MAGGGRARGLRKLLRPALPPALRTGAKVPAAGTRIGVLVRREGRTGRGPEIHRVPAAGLASCQRRRLADPRDPSRLHHAPATQPGTTRIRRRPRRPGPHLDRTRGHRGHPLGPRPGPGRRGGDGRSGRPPGRHLHDRSKRMSTEETRTWTGPSAPERLALLRQAKSIAIVGASDKPSRASYFVATYLQSSTRYKVYFVNPVVKEILGQPPTPPWRTCRRARTSLTCSASTTT